MKLEDLKGEVKASLLKFLSSTLCSRSISLHTFMNGGLKDIISEESSDRIPSKILPIVISKVTQYDVSIILKNHYYEGEILQALVDNVGELTFQLEGTIFTSLLNEISNKIPLSNIEWLCLNCSTMDILRVIKKTQICTTRILKAIHLDTEVIDECLKIRNLGIKWVEHSKVVIIPSAAYVLTHIPEETLRCNTVDWGLLSKYQNIPFEYLKDRFNFLPIKYLLCNEYLDNEKKQYVKNMLNDTGISI